MPIDDVDTAISFYDEWTTSEADDYQRTDAEGGGVSWIGDGRVIQVLAPLEGDDEVLITLTVNGN